MAPATNQLTKCDHIFWLHVLFSSLTSSVAPNVHAYTIDFLSTSFLILHSVCVYLLLFTVRLQQRSVTLFAIAPLSFSLSLTLPQTLPFSQRQNKLIRSEVRAYQWGISIQIKTLSGHKQQEAKQDPSAAEWVDGRGRETQEKQ